MITTWPGDWSTIQHDHHMAGCLKLSTIQHDHHMAEWLKYDSAWSPHGWMTKVKYDSAWSPHGWVTEVKYDSAWSPHGWVTEVKYDSAWSPHGWETVPCQALCPPRDYCGVKYCAGALYNSPSNVAIDNSPHVDTQTKQPHTHVKDPVIHVTVQWGLWKHQNSPACTKTVRVFKMLKLDTIWNNYKMKNAKRKRR